jgi:hypothetical protein
MFKGSEKVTGTINGFHPLPVSGLRKGIPAFMKIKFVWFYL